ncbi:DUF420 domain-containing protein [Candidatus Borrarchaeum sp.]|uniref:DUF420 domain-containing protein n=1 Tax=Candidatus Borrarchaeum sp. TaxID=2846742 RepID=UPI00257E0626|nr:DUF420 domain-containing protein [Candidatus Borrarchaeum sp.]
MVIFRAQAPLISDAILIVEIILAILLTLGFYFARKHRGTRHHWIMLSSFVAHIVFGVALMVISFSILLSIAEAASTIAHATIASLVVILAAINIILGFIWRAKDSPVMVLPPRQRRIHQTLGIILLLLWYFLVISGIFVYLTLY